MNECKHRPPLPGTSGITAGFWCVKCKQPISGWVYWDDKRDGYTYEVEKWVTKKGAVVRPPPS